MPISSHFRCCKALLVTTSKQRRSKIFTFVFNWALAWQSPHCGGWWYPRLSELPDLLRYWWISWPWLLMVIARSHGEFIAGHTVRSHCGPLKLLRPGNSRVFGQSSFPLIYEIWHSKPCPKNKHVSQFWARSAQRRLRSQISHSFISILSTV